eukprot:174072_1
MSLQCIWLSFQSSFIIYMHYISFCNLRSKKSRHIMYPRTPPRHYAPYGPNPNQWTSPPNSQWAAAPPQWVAAPPNSQWAAAPPHYYDPRYAYQNVHHPMTTNGCNPNQNYYPNNPSHPQNAQFYYRNEGVPPSPNAQHAHVQNNTTHHPSPRAPNKASDQQTKQSDPIMLCSGLYADKQDGRLHFFKENGSHFVPMNHRETSAFIQQLEGVIMPINESEHDSLVKALKLNKKQIWTLKTMLKEINYRARMMMKNDKQKEEIDDEVDDDEEEDTNTDDSSGSDSSYSETDSDSDDEEEKIKETEKLIHKHVMKHGKITKKAFGVNHKSYEKYYGGVTKRWDKKNCPYAKKYHFAFNGRWCVFKDTSKKLKSKAKRKTNPKKLTPKKRKRPHDNKENESPPPPPKRRRISPPPQDESDEEEDKGEEKQKDKQEIDHYEKEQEKENENQNANENKNENENQNRNGTNETENQNENQHEK